MSATNTVYRVTYHFEQGGKRCSDEMQDNVLAAASDYNTISAVLTGNGRAGQSGSKLVITSIGHESAISNVLS